MSEKYADSPHRDRLQNHSQNLDRLEEWLVLMGRVVNEVERELHGEATPWPWDEPSKAVETRR